MVSSEHGVGGGGSKSPGGSSTDVVVACCAVAAFGGAFSGVAPTGTWWWDPVLAAGLGIAFVVGATHAHRWALVAAAAIGALFVGFSPWLAVAVAGCLALSISIVRSPRRRGLRAVAGGLIFIALLHLEDPGFFGSSALLASLACIVVFASAVTHLDNRQQRHLRRVAIGAAAVIVVLGALAATKALTLRSTAADAIDAARAGIEAARAGDGDLLVAQLEDATERLAKVDAELGSPLFDPMLLLPIAAQHVRAVDTAAEQGLLVATEALAAARDGGARDLEFRQGSFDLDLLAEIAPRLEQMATKLDDATLAIEADRTGWLLPVLDGRIERLLDDLDRVRPEAALAAEAARLLPPMLGSEDERRYLLLFGSPGEAREFGGFVGGYGLISINDGDLELLDAGSINDLLVLARAGSLADPSSYPIQYVEADPVTYPQNLTSTPNISTMARAVREIFPTMEGAPIDGVVYLDPYAMAALTEFTGPVEMPGVDEPLFGEAVVDFVFDTQYRLFPSRQERFDAIADVARTTAEGFAGADLPGPERLGEVLGPVARAGRLQVITYDDAENAFLASVLLQRNFVAPESVDSVAVVHTNGTASKLDLFLHRHLSYDVTVDGDMLTAVAEVDLRSQIAADAPAHTFGETDGTNQVLLSLYSPHRLTRLTVDGEPHDFVVHEEFGFFRYALFKIPLPPNDQASVRFELEGRSPPHPYRLGVWAQPIANLDTVEVTFRTAGTEPVSTARELSETWLFDPKLARPEG